MNESENFWDKTAKTQDKDAKRFDRINTKVVENTKKYLNVSDIVLDHCCPVKVENVFWPCLNQTVLELTFQGQISRLFDHSEMLITQKSRG